MAAVFHKNEYLVQVTVVEARNLRGKDASGTSDPYVKITVGNLAPQVTTTAKATSSMAWSQSFTFTNLFLSDTELETMEILLEVFDLNDFALNPLIGAHSIGLATLYRNMNHEFYNAWLPLMNPEVSSDPQGYLLVSCFIISSNDQPPVHAINEIVYFDEEPDNLEGIPEEELTPEQIKARKDKHKRVAEISKPTILQRGYQLRINIAKAEDLAQIGYSLPDGFISVRCCGFTLTTPVGTETQKPVFNSKLQFPVHLPLMNDKIVIRVWDRRKGLPDYFIASVPEFPSETDYFNINSLLAKGGNMPYRWINLYGIPGSERTSDFAKMFMGKQKLYEGTAYMGKVLMSINLAPNEKPVKGRFPLNSYREPPEIDYNLYADVYELQEGVGCGESVWIKVSIGSHVRESARAHNTGQNQTTYTWKAKKILLPDITAPFPTDQGQIPDIFVSVYTETFWGEKRIAYLRLPVTDPTLTHTDPKWYQLKSVENNVNETKAGFLLINLHFTSSKKKGSRVAKRRNINAKFLFISYIHAGYDLSPDLPPESVFPSAELNVSNRVLTPKKNEHQGKNPVWEEFLFEEVELTQNLEFASNIMLKIKNVPKGFFLLSKGQELMNGGMIGEFSIPAMDCTQIKKIEDFTLAPKLYIIYRDGKPQGRILASFTLVKNIKKMNDIEGYLNQKKSSKIKCNLEFAVIGIRNLMPPFKNPTIHMTISGSDKKAEPLKCIMDDDGGEFANPNFLSVIKINDVELPQDSLYLPSVEIEVKNNKMLTSSLYCSLPLREYAVWEQSTRLAEVNNIFNTPMRPTVIKKEEKKEEKTDAQKKGEKDKDQGKGDKDKLKAAGAVVINIPGGDLKNVPEEGKKVIVGGKQEKGKEVDIVFKDGNKAGEGKKKDGQQWNLENLQEELNDAKAEQADREDSDDEFIARTTAASDSNYRMEPVEELDCTKKDKDKERSEKKQEIDTMIEKIKELKKEPVPRPEEINKYVQQINKLKENFVDRVKFAGHSDKMGEDYDYGRPITKEIIENDLALPYLNYDLCKFIPIIGSSSREENGIIKSGIISGARLKGLLRVVPQDQETQEAMEKKSNRSKNSKASRTSRASSKNRGLKFKSNDENPEYPFDIFTDIYMKYFRSPKPLKIRLYLLRGLNLTAQADVVELNNRLAGFSAMSSASTFPGIQVGQPDDQGFDLTKAIYDDKATVENTLNPSYFRNYELDAQFPNDWKLEISVMNKGTIKDALIGQTIVDLEDRYFGDKLTKQKLAYDLLKKNLEEEFRRLENEQQNPTSNTLSNLPELEKRMNEVRREIAKLTGLLESLGKPMSLVEYRPLKKEGKTTSQGSLEMFVEVLTTDIARTQPIAKIEPPKPTEYEIRVVIFETFDIPRVGETVDIFVKVSYSPDGWSGEEIVKSTDTHLGSSDGYGIFNWRMKFPLVIPCSFPRLRFMVYDMNVFASDQSIGEAAVSLRRIIKKLYAEGRFEQAPRKIKLSHPNMPGKVLGEVVYSLQIIPKMEAEASPVGEAQEEPNENPYLEKPKIGRGISDFLKGVGFSFNIWGFLTGRIFKVILGMIGSLIITLILFVKPGILVK